MLRHSIAARLTIGALALAAAAAVARCQDSASDPITIGFTRTVDSEILGESRRLLIALPEGHAKSEARYPVVYLLDGDMHFAHTAALLRFEAQFGRMPPAILVAIPNTDRTRDLTPPTTAEKDTFLTAGGVDAFLRFMREEIHPLIASEFRASDHRTLIGHSFGGMAVLHCLVHSPTDYHAYLAISPSLWWDEQRLIAQAASAFPKAEGRDQRLFLTIGDEDGRMLAGFRRMEALLAEHPPNGLQWQAMRMTAETHQTVPYRGTVHGLRFLYLPWARPGLGELLAAGGWEALDAERSALMQRFGLTRPRDFRITVQVTDELLAARRFDELFELYESAPKDLPVPPVAWEVFGERALAAGDRSAARRAYTEALRANPAAASIRKTLRKVGGDPDAIPRPAPLDPKRAAALSGVYREGVGDSKLVLRVNFEDGKLIATLPDGARAPLDQDEGDRFRLFEGYVMVTFRFATGADLPTDLTFTSQGAEPRILVREER